MQSLFLVATFLQIMNAQRRGSNTRHPFIVDREYDHTPVELLRLDNYLLDAGVLAFIQGTYECDYWEGWYDENKVEADDYFTPPYCDTAITVLGYPSERARAQEHVNDVNEQNENARSLFSQGFHLAQSDEESSTSGLAAAVQNDNNIE
jgi:hypothetical protein